MKKVQPNQYKWKQMNPNEKSAAKSIQVETNEPKCEKCTQMNAREKVHPNEHKWKRMNPNEKSAPK
jgi:hypothetical protein